MSFHNTSSFLSCLVNWNSFFNCQVIEWMNKWWFLFLRLTFCFLGFSRLTLFYWFFRPRPHWQQMTLSSASSHKSSPTWGRVLVTRSSRRKIKVYGSPRRETLFLDWDFRVNLRSFGVFFLYYIWRLLSREQRKVEIVELGKAMTSRLFTWLVRKQWVHFWWVKREWFTFIVSFPKQKSLKGVV